jgi:hypothetical protein
VRSRSLFRWGRVSAQAWKSFVASRGSCPRARARLGSTEKSGHGGCTRAVVAGGGACLSRRTPVTIGLGGSLGARGNTAMALRHL